MLNGLFFIRISVVILALAAGTSCSHTRKAQAPDLPARHPSSGPSVLLPKVQLGLGKLKVKAGEAWGEMKYMTEQLQCVRDICGPEAKNYSQTDAAWDELNPQEIYKPGSPEYDQIDSLLRQNIQLEIEEYRDLKSEVLALQRDLDRIPLGLKNYINLNEVVVKNFVPLLTHRLKKGTWFLNYKSIKTPTREEWEEIGVSASRIEFLDELAQNGFFSKVAELIDRWSWTYEHLIKMDYPDLKVEGSESKIAKDCLLFLDILRSQLQMPSDFSFGTECESIQKNPNFPINRYELQQSFIGLTFFSALLNPRFTQISERHPLALKQRIDEFIRSDAFRLLEKYENIQSPDQQGEVLRICHKLINQNLVFAGSELRIRQIQKHIQRLVDLTPTVAGITGPKHIQYLSQELGRLTFTTPSPRRHSLDFILRDLKSTIDVRRESKRHANIKAINGLFFVFGSHDDLELDSDGQPVNLFTDLREQCDELQLRALTDHVYTSSGSVYLSWLSVQRPEYGIGIAAHEIGHFVERTLEKMSAEHKVEILEKIQKKEIPPVLTTFKNAHLDHLEKRLPYCHTSPESDPQGDTQYVSEDFADYFGALLLKEYSKEAPWVRNFGCSLVREQNGYYVIDRVNNTRRDHSRHAFRILNIENTWRVGKVPKSCESFKARALRCEPAH